MKKLAAVLQVSFTYVGTVVGAGFATGQEILQFFTKYGGMASYTIWIAALLFMWLGIKVMLLAHETKAKSYEDLNKLLFGERIGSWISIFMMIMLFGVTTVMLAGAGSVFAEQLKLPYQAGLLFTLIVAFVLLIRGMDGIIAVNSIVVPSMLIFCGFAVYASLQSPNMTNWRTLSTDHSALRIWLAPFLYAAFNLSMAQAVLVPLGARIRDRSVLIWGGLLGGLIIGLMLLANHFVLSSFMPAVMMDEIPMGRVTMQFGAWLQLLFIFVIYSEIFTTFIADIYGLTLQLKPRSRISERSILLLIMLLSYVISLFGFKTLVSSLYPLFGLVSMAWLILLIHHRNELPRSRHT